MFFVQCEVTFQKQKISWCKSTFNDGCLYPNISQVNVFSLIKLSPLLKRLERQER